MSPAPVNPIPRSPAIDAGHPGRDRLGGNRGFTLLELLTVIAVLSILIAILAPVLTSGINYAHMTTCKTNLRTIYEAAVAYGTDYKTNPENVPQTHAQPEMFWRFSNGSGDHPHEAGRNRGLPGTPAHALYSNGYIKNPEVFFCPLAPVTAEPYFNPTPVHDYKTFHGTYSWGWRSVRRDLDPYPGINSNGIRYAPEPPTDAVMYDAPHRYWVGLFRQPPGYRHEHYNVLFKQGHVRMITKDGDAFWTWLWGPTARPY